MHPFITYCIIYLLYPLYLSSSSWANRACDCIVISQYEHHLVSIPSSLTHIHFSRMYRHNMKQFQPMIMNTVGVSCQACHQIADDCFSIIVLPIVTEPPSCYVLYIFHVANHHMHTIILATVHCTAPYNQLVARPSCITVVQLAVMCDDTCHCSDTIINTCAISLLWPIHVMLVTTNGTSTTTTLVSSLSIHQWINSSCTEASSSVVGVAQVALVHYRHKLCTNMLIIRSKLSMFRHPSTLCHHHRL